MDQFETVGVLEFVDDFGEHRWTVWQVKDGCYYFHVLSWDGNVLRYNDKEERIEQMVSPGVWDVFDSAIFQASFIDGDPGKA